MQSTRVRRATVIERAKYLSQLERLLHPAPAYLSVVAGSPAHLPGGTLSPSYTPTGVAACIVERESGGNPQATNGQYHGIAQWGHPAWVKDGGLKYSYDPLGATYEQQLLVLSYGLSHFGSGDWSNFDGC